MLLNSMNVENFLMVLNYMNEQDILQLRQVDQALSKLISAATPIPYQNKQGFLVSNTGTYREKNLANAAWQVYSTTMSSPSKLPAVLYALDEGNYLESAVFPQISNGEDLHTTGRRYQPSEHRWDVNAAWVLAQIHKERSCLIVSDYPGINHSYRKGGDYSALTKEISFVQKAEYVVLHMTFNYNRLIYLLSPVKKNNFMPLRSFNGSRQDHEYTINYFFFLQTSYETGKEAAEIINSMFSSLNKKHHFSESNFYLAQINLAFSMLSSQYEDMGFLDHFDQSILGRNNDDGIDDIEEIKSKVIEKLNLLAAAEKELTTVIQLSIFNKRDNRDPRTIINENSAYLSERAKAKDNTGLLDVDSDDEIDELKVKKYFS